jgi:hypothetical protein
MELALAVDEYKWYEKVNGIVELNGFSLEYSIRSIYLLLCMDLQVSEQQYMKT